jgi:hypothetical protein
MGIVANTFETYQAIGNREDLANTIYNISPSDVPFMSMIGRSKAKNTLVEWQTDSLASAVATNAQKEGDDYAFDAVTPTVRLTNHTQISRKTIIVSGSQQAGNHAGVSSELAYGLAKKSKELKRDMETCLTNKVAKAAGASDTARTLGGLETWIATNTSRGGGTPVGSGAGGGAAPVDAGTPRAFTVAMLKSVIQACYSAGSDSNTIMVGPHNKGVLSGFAGRDGARQMGAEKKINVAADLFSSDFGDYKVIPNRFQRDKSAFIIDPEYWSVAYYRDFKQEEVAKTGDAIKRALLVEFTLVSKNEASSGIIADLTTS